MGQVRNRSLLPSKSKARCSGFSAVRNRISRSTPRVRWRGHHPALCWNWSLRFCACGPVRLFLLCIHLYVSYLLALRQERNRIHCECMYYNLLSSSLNLCHSIPGLLRSRRRHLLRRKASWNQIQTNWNRRRVGSSQRTFAGHAHYMFSMWSFRTSVDVSQRSLFVNN